MFPLIGKYTTDQQLIPKICGMLIDLEVFEVQEILNLFENPAQLKERIEEALELI